MFFHNSFYLLVLFIILSRFQSAFSDFKTNNSDAIFNHKNTTDSQRYRTPLLRISALKNNNQLENVNDNQIIDEEELKIDTTAPLHGIYTDCLLELSFSCVQRKVLLFIDRISRKKDFQLLGSTFSVVRTKKELAPVLNEYDLINRMRNQKAATTWSSLIDSSLEKFVQNHVLRINLPSGMSAAVATTARDNTVLSSPSGNIIDINVSRSFDETTARGKGGKKLKKFFGMMLTGLLGKLAFLGPFMVVLIKLKALKALILSKIALALSLMHMFKGKKGGGGSHGKEVIIVHDAHGSSSSSGGHEGYSGSAWGTGAGGWVTGGQVDSYSSGVHTGGGDSTYSGGDSYAGGHGGWAGGGATQGWGRRSSSGDPQWVAYRAFIPNAEEDDK